MLTGEISFRYDDGGHIKEVKMNIYNDRILMVNKSTICRFVPESLIRSFI